jgi:hypothetical protein
LKNYSYCLVLKFVIRLWPVAALFSVYPITYAGGVPLAPAAACHDALHALSAGTEAQSIGGPASVYHLARCRKYRP